ncbi:hypothetical protein B0J17DRAFT_668701 [Rhizoctonia solani]|nr:hypothetical protein B0J17DRAFT_668701 [Rhizoctonia solani]
MRLSQYVFKLQFARYTHDSSAGYFVSKTEPEEQSPVTPQSAQEAQELPTPHEAPDLEDESQNPKGPSILEAKQVLGTSSGLVQLGETIVRAIKESSSESKNILQNMDRILTSMKNDQSTVGCMSAHYHIFKNPFNRKGVLASEHGLPHLCYWYYNNTGKFALLLNNTGIARYLEFFEIGADLVQGDDEPKLIDGKYDEAEKLLLAQVGLGYS